MEPLKLNFCGFWGSFDKQDNLFTRILSRRFEVEISEQPDFVICSNRGRPFEYMRYDCVRIMFMGENLSPDFTVFDYVIGFDHMDFGDRYFRLPFAFYSDDAVPWQPETLSLEQAKEILGQKRYFCNFIYGHPSATGMRERLFRALEQYKPVVSPGSYLNNTGTKGCGWQEKYRYLEQSKFTVAGDSICYPGFVTEKIVQPFQRHSVPIYFGNPRIGEDFNEEAFIWCRSDSEEDVKAAVERAAWLDTHDDEYLAMLMKDPLPRQDLAAEKYQALEAFLFRIFSQPPAQAGRRIGAFCAERHETLLRECMRANEKDGLLPKAKQAVRSAARSLRK